MIPSVRRAPSVLRCLRFPTSSIASLHLSQSSRRQIFVPTFSQLPQVSRAFSISSRYFQQPAAVEDDIASQGSTQEFTKFEELGQHGLVSPVVIDTITNRMNIHTMTDVQRMTLNECLYGTDVIAQARTGTGKTLAFLLPIVQRILKDPSLERRSRNQASASDIRALIISPTRELAEQIAVEAKKLVQNTSVKVQTAVGGTQKSFHLRQIQQQGCHILVGTPGRVCDILQDQRSGVSLENIETFVLDEADRLLDIGFAPAISEIQTYMPSRQQRNRQTLMFSATVPKSVVSLVRETMRPDFKFVRTVDPDEAPTHERIPQKVVFMRGLQNQLPSILEIAQTAIDAHKRDPENNKPFKAIVYFGSTNEVSLAHEVFTNMREPDAAGGRGMFSSHPLSPCHVYQMHSKLVQGQRTRQSESFRRANSAILFSSDVTARGMDFPDVTHVIQIGLPKSPDDYVHRLGRTGRAGKSGEGWLILNEDERREYRAKMAHSGIKIDDAQLQTAELDMTRSAQLPANIARMMKLIEVGVKSVPFPVKAQVYSSLLGVLNQQYPGRRKQSQIDLMNDLARYGWGMAEPPTLNQSLVQKLGFGNCTGINFSTREDSFGGPPRGGRSGGRGGRDSFNDKDPFGLGASAGRGVFGAPEESGSRGSFGGGYRDREGGRSGGFRGGRGGGRDGGRDGGRNGGFSDRRGGDSSFGDRGSRRDQFS